MLRKIEVKNGKEIWKSSDNRTGEIGFYGVRSAGQDDKPFDHVVQRLKQARELLVTA